ncbi:MAG: hypothetical protein IJK86_08345 [Lachnospiraceae bacterium]|nr:hypothetical protein [Lachnospiraceae bacterium]
MKGPDRSIKLYLTAELLLLITVKAADLTAAPAWTVGAAGFAAILLNAAAAFFYYRKYGRERRAGRENLAAYALFVTLAGDFFLTLIGTEAVYVPGIALFCLAEMLYAAYLGPDVRSVSLQAVLTAAGIFALHRTGELTAASALGALDLALLTVNMLTAWTRAAERTPLLFRLGITLFFLCDSSIALRVVTTGTVREIVAFLVWVFYAPSQAAITMSYVRSVTQEGRDRGA